MKAGVIVRLLSFSRVEELAQKHRGRQTIRTHCTLVCDVGNFLLCKKTTRNTNHQLLPQSYTSKSDQRTETGGAEWAWERAAGADLFIQTSYHHCCCFHNTNWFKLQIHNYEGKRVTVHHQIPQSPDFTQSLFVCLRLELNEPDP